MTLISIDVESDGPCPGIYNLISIGAVSVEDLKNRFYCEVAPITYNYNPEALAISKLTRNQHLEFPDPEQEIKKFYEWLKSFNQPVMISDNPAFDWQFVNYYLHKFCGENPLGFSARRIGDIYCGVVRDLRANYKWKRFRKTKHSHNALDDAVGNAEAFIEICKREWLNK